jgi:hypothetical protein
MESNDLRALSELYLKTVYEAKAESPEEEEEKDKKDDDLAGSPNKNGKKNGKKAKRWWDDDGDGKGYEKGEVDGKFPDKDGSKKKKKHNCASKVKHEEFGVGNCIKGMHDLNESGEVAHYDVFFEHGIEKNVPVSSLEILEGHMHEHVIHEGKKNCGCGQDPCITYGKGKNAHKMPDGTIMPGKTHKEEVEDLTEISADKALEASKAADVQRGKLAVAGDKAGAAKKSAQAVRLYKAQAKKRLNREEVEVDEGYEEKKKSEVLSAMKKQGRKLSDKDKDKIANKVVASKGDTSKSDDRYAYEELDPGMEHNLSILRMLAEKEVNVKDTKKVVDAIRAYDKSKDASRDATDDSDKGDKEGAAVEKKYAAKERGEIKKDDPNWKNKKYHTGMHGEEVESLVASGKFSNEELMSIANLQEADIADILARLEKKRISKGGDPDESPLGKKTGRAMKSQQDKARKKAGLKTEEIELDEAERKLADRLARKRKLYDKTTKKAMQFARDEGEASGHARYRMSSISREMDGIKAKMNKEK